MSDNNNNTYNYANYNYYNDNNNNSWRNTVMNGGVENNNVLNCPDMNQWSNQQNNWYDYQSEILANINIYIDRSRLAPFRRYQSNNVNVNTMCNYYDNNALNTGYGRCMYDRNPNYTSLDFRYRKFQSNSYG